MSFCLFAWFVLDLGRKEARFIKQAHRVQSSLIHAQQTAITTMAYRLKTVRYKVSQSSLPLRNDYFGGRKKRNLIGLGRFDFSRAHDELIACACWCVSHFTYQHIFSFYMLLSFVCLFVCLVFPRISIVGFYSKMKMDPVHYWRPPMPCC